MIPMRVCLIVMKRIKVHLAEEWRHQFVTVFVAMRMEGILWLYEMSKMRCSLMVRLNARYRYSDWYAMVEILRKVNLRWCNCYHCVVIVREISPLGFRLSAGRRKRHTGYWFGHLKGTFERFVIVHVYKSSIQERPTGLCLNRSSIWTLTNGLIEFFSILTIAFRIQLARIVVIG